MPTIVTVMSWNIESFGGKKAIDGSQGIAQESELINFINLAIREAGADVVGIMEIKGGVGRMVLGWLLAKLNNLQPAGVMWKGSVSSRQDGGTQEETLYLWREEANRLTTDATAIPGPTWSIGIADNEAMNSLFTTKNWASSQDRTAFYAALADSGYVEYGRFGSNKKTKTWRVAASSWGTLSTMAPPQITITGTAQPPPPGLSAADCQAVAQKLVAIDMLRFPTFADRSPYVAHLLVGSPGKSLTIALLHVPGPQDPTRTDSINIMAMSAILQHAAGTASLLVMGDFNIGVTQLADRSDFWARKTAFGQWGFVRDVMANPNRQTVFAPITGAPLNALNQLGNERTSLARRTFMPDTAPLSSARANAYDRFFFHDGGITAGQGQVVDLLARLINGNPAFSAALAQAAMTFFRAYRGPAAVTKAANTLANTLGKKNRELGAARLSYQRAKLAYRAARQDGETATSQHNRMMTAQRDCDAIAQEIAQLTTEQHAIAAVQTLVGNPGSNAATGTGTALAIYRVAASDHLPITIQLTA